MFDDMIHGENGKINALPYSKTLDKSLAGDAQGVKDNIKKSEPSYKQNSSSQPEVKTVEKSYELEKESKNGKFQSKVKQKDLENKIDKYYAKIFDEGGDVKEDNPKQIMETYEKLQMEILTHGKTGFSKAFTVARIKLGNYSLTDAFEKANKEYEVQYKEFEKLENDIQKKLSDIDIKRLGYEDRQQDIMELGSSLQIQKENLKAQMQQIQSKNGYQTQEDRHKLAEIRQKTASYTSKLNRAAHENNKIKGKIKMLNSQYNQTEKRLIQTRDNMAQVYERQNPVQYLSANIQLLSKIADISNAVATIDETANKLIPGAKKLYDIVEKAQIRNIGNKVDFPEISSDEVENKINDYKNDVLDDFMADISEYKNGLQINETSSQGKRAA